MCKNQHSHRSVNRNPRSPESEHLLVGGVAASAVGSEPSRASGIVGRGRRRAGQTGSSSNTGRGRTRRSLRCGGGLRLAWWAQQADSRRQARAVRADRHPGCLRSSRVKPSGRPPRGAVTGSAGRAGTPRAPERLRSRPSHAAASQLRAHHAARQPPPGPPGPVPASQLSAGGRRLLTRCCACAPVGGPLAFWAEPPGLPDDEP